MRHCMTTILAAAMFGCAAPPDLTNSTTLPEADRVAARRLAQQITLNCRYMRIFEGDYPRPPVEMQIDQLARIHRLYTSPSGWYKAEFSADNLNGIAYHHPASRRFVCGESTWKKWPNSHTIIFSEVGGH